MHLEQMNCILSTAKKGYIGSSFHKRETCSKPALWSDKEKVYSPTVQCPVTDSGDSLLSLGSVNFINLLFFFFLSQTCGALGGQKSSRLHYIFIRKGLLARMVKRESSHHRFSMSNIRMLYPIKNRIALLWECLRSLNMKLANFQLYADFYRVHLTGQYFRHLVFQQNALYLGQEKDGVSESVVLIDLEANDKSLKICPQ